MPGVLDRLYAHSPVWMQNVGVSLYGLAWRHRRFGGGFSRYVAAFAERERYSQEDWRLYQTEELRKLLAHAAARVPYYQRTCGQRLRDCARFELEQLPELPLLEKDHIRPNPDAFVADTVSPRNLHVYHTSGTTGTPLAIKFTNDMHRRWSAAYETRVRRWAGVNHTMSRAMIGGRVVVPRANVAPPFWRYNFVERQLYLSAFHISPKNAPHYAAAFTRYKPDYLVGYASSHYFLARMINEQSLSVPRPKAVLTSSEKLTAQMRAEIEKAYGCPVFDAYSGVEACCLASECERHRLHVSPDVGVIELVDEERRPVKPGQQGEIVATGLLNFEQPLIRYRTGDMATWSDKPCPCGRAMPVIEELVGRLEDTVVGADGREMVRFHGIFVGLPHVREGQVIQEALTRIRVRLVITPEFDDHDRQTIASRFEQRLGPVDLRLEFVDHIERTERGKFRAVISHVRRGEQQPT